MNPQFVSKYRPKTLQEILLPQRIKKVFENYEKEGLTHSYIFHGKFGLGKTTLARILAGQYTKRNPYLYINISKDTSINVLRERIEPFCKETYIGLDLEGQETFDSEVTKVVIMDEFDRASIQLQEALKAFTEEYEEKGIRFIGVTNHIHKIDDGLKSRFTYINFNPINVEERKTIKQALCIFLYDIITVKEKKTIEKDDVRKIVNKNYPDIRACIRLAEHYVKFGELNDTVIAEISDQVKFLELLLEPNTTYDTFYHYLMTKYGDMGIGNLFDTMESPLIQYVFDQGYPVEPLFMVNGIVIKYRSLLPNATDPILTGMATIGEVRKVLFNNHSEAEYIVNSITNLIKK